LKMSKLNVWRQTGRDRSILLDRECMSPANMRSPIPV
jgi:hypothetical protein